MNAQNAEITSPQLSQQCFHNSTETEYQAWVRFTWIAIPPEKYHLHTLQTNDYCIRHNFQGDFHGLL